MSHTAIERLKLDMEILRSAPDMLHQDFSVFQLQTCITIAAAFRALLHDSAFQSDVQRIKVQGIQPEHGSIRQCDLPVVKLNTKMNTKISSV